MTDGDELPAPPNGKGKKRRSRQLLLFQTVCVIMGGEGGVHVMENEGKSQKAGRESSPSRSDGGAHGRAASPLPAGLLVCAEISPSPLALAVRLGHVGSIGGLAPPQTRGGLRPYPRSVSAGSFLPSVPSVLFF